jgi:leucyl-tRNA synthetase
MAILEGEKMSSSKGNIIAINEAVRQYGADTVRIYLMSVSEPWQDLDWRAAEVAAMQRNLERFHSLAEGIISLPGGRAPTPGLPERWVLSRLQNHVKAVTDALESFETRKAVQHAFFMLAQDIRRYMRRAENIETGAPVLKEVLAVWLRLLAPFAPHVCEELWEKSGGEGFVSVAGWPTVDTGKIDEAAEFYESLIDRVMEDLGKIKKILKTKPRRACLYVAREWKWSAYRATLEHVKTGKIDFGKLLREVECKLGPGIGRAELSNLLRQAIVALRELREEEVKLIESSQIDEFEILSGASDFIRKQLGLGEVLVFREDDRARYDPDKRAASSIPLRPAIYLE